MKHPLVEKIAYVMPAVLVVAFSYACYAMFLNGHEDAFHAHGSDPADYRYVAEQFWGVESDIETYQWEDWNAWPSLLREIPFRPIGLGTYYLGVAKVSSLFSDRYPLSHDILPALAQMQLALVHIVFFWVCRKRFGLTIGLLALAGLMFPPWAWIPTEYFMTEIYVRMLLLLAASALLHYNGDNRKILTSGVPMAMLFLLLCTHLKPQWMLAAALLGIVASIRWLIVHEHITFIMPAFIASLMIPASIYAVNVTGWDTHALTAGVSLHANRITNGKGVEAACIGKSKPPYCDREHRNDFWLMTINENVTKEHILELDDKLSTMLFDNINMRIHRVQMGLSLATNFPYDVWGHRPYAEFLIPLLRLLNAVVWTSLIVGLFHKNTIILAGFGLAIWTNSAVGNMISLYTPRYELPVAGIPLVLSFLIFTMAFRRIKVCKSILVDIPRLGHALMRVQ